jgi:hypothetical protein
MTGFLTEIGSKLADRWAALLALPGLLYLAVVTAAAVLGQQHALSYPFLDQKITGWADSSVLKSVGGTVLIVAAILAGSVLAGLAATAGGRFIETLWTLPGRRAPARWLTDWRKRRARNAKAIADDEHSSPAQARKAIRQADRICLVEPDRPTWIGDRLRACHVRVLKTYGLDLVAAWPRLWLIVPDAVRDELGTAREAFSGAARLAAWAIFYLVLGAWWWPAVPIGLVAGIAAVSRGRLATGNLADLIESTVDLHGRELGPQLGLPDPLTPATGRQLTTLMAKSRWDPASPLAD